MSRHKGRKPQQRRRTPVAAIGAGPTRAAAPAAPAAAPAARPVLPLPVPLGVPAGPTTVADVLDEITPQVLALAERLRRCPPSGFLVTAADGQRREVLLDLLDQAGRVLGERVDQQ